MSSQAGQSSFVLTRRLADGTVEWIPLQAPQRVPADPAASYALIDRAEYEAPQTLVARRQGENLVVEVQGNEVLVLDGFFATENVAFYPTTDIAGGAGPFSGEPLTADSPVQSGSPEQVVWSAEPVQDEQVAQSTEGDAGGGSALLWGGLAAGGLGLALAAGGGGGGGGGSDPVGGDPGGGDDPDTTAPEITSAATAAEIAEASGAGQVVYTATATDAGEVTWSLAADGDAAAFSIDAATGAVTLTENPDFETKASYAFTVVATDDAGNSSELAVSLPVADLDELGPVITSGATAEDVDENSGSGQVVYTAAADGPATWSLEATGDAAAFTIDAATGAVSLSDDPDHEAKPSYTFTVVATDADGNSSSQAVSLAINDLDEVAPTITSGAAATTITENSGAGQVVYTVTSTDDGDVSAGSTSYGLAPVGDAASFSIDAATGAVTLIDDPDFETKPSYSFTVVATDAAGNSSEQAVTLTIADLTDETAPTVTGVALTGADGALNGILNAGDTVTITVTMSEAVNVDTSGGTPRIGLAIGDATTFADYSSGSGTETLVFVYTVQPGDTDSNGIMVRPNGLETNGGAITDLAGNAGDLQHGPVPSDPAFVVDAIAPTLSSSTPANDAVDFAVGDDIVLTFSENVLAGSGTITISDGTDVRTIDIADATQVSISGSQVTINPTADLNPDSTYSVLIDDGALTDVGGTAFAGISDSTALDFTTASAPIADPAIVVFDLVQGVSSDHSGRNFSSDVSYSIYIRVDSDSADLNTDGEGGPGTWGMWTGATNLGSDDRVVLVGDGAPVQGFISSVNGVSVDSSAIAWTTLFGFAGRLQEESFTRFAGGDDDDTRLFETSLPTAFFAGQEGQIGTMYATQIPGGILTTQGLAP